MSPKETALKKILALVAGVMALFAVLASAPAQAAPETSISAQYALPPDAAGWKFWTPSVCVDAGSGIPDDIASQTYYRVAYLAQQWNLRTSLLQLDYEADCAAAGYPPSRIMVIGTFKNTTLGACYQQTNRSYTDYTNGMYRWTNSPGMYINLIPGCVDNQTMRDHMVSAAIGEILGAKLLNSSGYDSRVMNMTAWSRNNVALPDQNTANLLDAIYAYTYCQPFGTTC